MVTAMITPDIAWTQQQLRIYKQHFGFADWVVTGVFHKEDMINPKYVAEADWDIPEKILRIHFYSPYNRMDRARKKNTIIHEFIHARISIAQDSAKPMFEEQAINDIVRGVSMVRK